MKTLTYTQCISCQAIGCRKTKEFQSGAPCKLCGETLHEITKDDYEKKLHFTNIPHEEGLLPERMEQ